MKTFTLTFLFFALSMGCFAQIQYNTLWMKSYGGSLEEMPVNLIEVPGNGYLVYGYSNSSDGDVSANYGDYDIWIIKVDAEGELEWEKNYGGSAREDISSVRITPDGGYILAGSTQSNDHDVTVNYGESDFWIVKINATGAIEWQKSVGTAGTEYSYDVAIDDDGYIVAGRGNTYNVVKVSNSGELMWTRNIVSYAGYTGIADNGDGSFVLSGYYYDSYYFQYCLMAKITGSGIVVWQENYTENRIRDVVRMVKDNNGNYVMVAGSYNTEDLWMLKVNDLGTRIWEKVYDSPLMYIHGLALADEGFLVSGYGSHTDIGIYNMIVSPAGDSIAGFYSVGMDHPVNHGTTIQTSQNTFLGACDMFLDWNRMYEFTLVKTCEGDPVTVTLSDSTYCPPALLWANEGFERYRWTRGTYTDTTFVGDTRVLEVSQGGHYNVTAWNAYGCPSYASFNVPDPLFTPQRKDLCFVTVDEATGFNKVVFSDINPQSVVDSIYVYRINEFNQEVIIGRIGIDENEFIDVNSNPTQQTYWYKVANLDTCGLIVRGEYHTTLLLQSSVGSNDEVNLMWNPYQGFAYDYTELYRSVKTGEVWGDYIKIAQLPVNSLSYTDLTPPAGSKRYQLRITPPEACAGMLQVCSNVRYTDLCGTMLLELIVTNATCGASDGAASIEVSGGTPPYTFTWNGYLHGSTITNLYPGVYHLQVVDAEGCEETTTVTVANMAPELWTETLPDDIRTVECEGKIALHVTGMLPPYTCSLDNVPVVAINDTIYNVCAGNHVLIVSAGPCFVTTNTLVETTAIPEGIKAGVYKLYPQPFTDELVLEMNHIPFNASQSQSGQNLQSGTNSSNVTIYTLQGTPIITQEITSQRTILNTTTLKPGVYVLKVCVAGEWFVSKVVRK